MRSDLTVGAENGDGPRLSSRNRQIKPTLKNNGVEETS